MLTAILWVILIVLLFVWLVGFLLDVAGAIVHFLLIIVLAILIWNLVMTFARRAD